MIIIYYRLIGWGQIRSGIKIDPVSQDDWVMWSGHLISDAIKRHIEKPAMETLFNSVDAVKYGH